MDTASTDVAMLLRRTGFAPTAAERAVASSAGFIPTARARVAQARTTIDAADSLAPPTFAPFTPLDRSADEASRRQALAKRLATDRRENIALAHWWCNRMAQSTNSLREKATFIAHDHFATSVETVKSAKLMYDQNQLLRTYALGDFAELMRRLVSDAAMLVWLDGDSNVAQRPNENFAREFFELFTLGIGHYTETDVKEAARAFTGWSYTLRTQHVAFVARRHDNKTKTVLGKSGNFGSDDIVRIAMTDATARNVAAHWWSRLAYPVTIDDSVVNDVAARFAQRLDIGDLVEAILLHDAFRSDAARTGLLKTPLEYVIGTMRLFNLTAEKADALRTLESLGQLPFRPPSVGGWPGNEGWCSAAAALTRAQFAARVVRSADLRSLSGRSTNERVDALAELLGVVWSEGTAATLHAHAGDVSTLAALALVAPEYQVN
ncbi:MAG: DUF1800 domain-containing protein [Acidimicrobiia bacterium]